MKMSLYLIDSSLFCRFFFRETKNKKTEELTLIMIERDLVFLSIIIQMENLENNGTFIIVQAGAHAKI